MGVLKLSGVPTGPHFVEYLGYEVTPECCVILKCKVRRRLQWGRVEGPLFYPYVVGWVNLLESMETKKSSSFSLLLPRQGYFELRFPQKAH